MKILVIATGGTIGSIKGDSISLDSDNLKILSRCARDGVKYVGVSPFSVLSENMSIALWRRLIDYIDCAGIEDYAGVIILHGSDTLAYTSAVIANAFPNSSIVLTAADKPIEDEASNGVANFNLAVDMIADGVTCPMVAYDGAHRADSITSADVNDKFISINSAPAPADSRNIADKNILIVKSYVGMDMNNYNLDNVDAVIVDMFHSATVPDCVRDYARASDVPFYFVTHKMSAEYETAQDIDNIVFGCTVENLYARLLLTN